MTKSTTNPQVDDFLQKAKKWQDEMTLLRTIVLESGLEEDFKWRQPCYTLDGKNIVIVSGFKEYCLLGFFKGALLKDEHQLFETPGENTQSMRQLRFTSVDDIQQKKSIIRDYVREMINAEKAGLKVELKKSTELEFSEELKAKFQQDPTFQKAFEALTPGRRRAYNMFFSAAKQSKTRESRIEKYMPKILEGKAMDD